MAEARHPTSTLAPPYWGPPGRGERRALGNPANCRPRPRSVTRPQLSPRLRRPPAPRRCPAGHVLGGGGDDRLRDQPRGPGAAAGEGRPPPGPAQPRQPLRVPGPPLHRAASASRVPVWNAR